MEEPEFQKGKHVVISPNTQWENEDSVVVANPKQEKTLKRIKTDESHIYLISENRKYDPIVLDKKDNPRVIGEVVRKIKRY